MQYLIISKNKTSNYVMFWTQSKYGYTNDVDKAGRFSEEESAAIVAGSPEKDLRIPESEIGSVIIPRRIVCLDDACNLENIMRHDTEVKS